MQNWNRSISEWHLTCIFNLSILQGVVPDILKISPPNTLIRVVKRLTPLTTALSYTFIIHSIIEKLAYKLSMHHIENYSHTYSNRSIWIQERLLYTTSHSRNNWKFKKSNNSNIYTCGVSWLGHSFDAVTMKCFWSKLSLWSPGDHIKLVTLLVIDDNMK